MCAPDVSSCSAESVAGDKDNFNRYPGVSRHIVNSSSPELPLGRYLGKNKAFIAFLVAVGILAGVTPSSASASPRPIQGPPISDSVPVSFAPPLSPTEGAVRTVEFEETPDCAGFFSALQDMDSSFLNDLEPGKQYILEETLKILRDIFSDYQKRGPEQSLQLASPSSILNTLYYMTDTLDDIPPREVLRDALCSRKTPDENLELLELMTFLATSNQDEQLLDYLLQLRALEEHNIYDDGSINWANLLRSRYEEMLAKSGSMPSAELNDSLVSPSLKRLMLGFIASLPSSDEKHSLSLLELVGAFSGYLRAEVPYSSLYLKQKFAKKKLESLEQESELRPLFYDSPPFFFPLESLEEYVRLINSRVISERKRRLGLIADFPIYSRLRESGIDYSVKTGLVICINYAKIMSFFLDLLDVDSSMVAFISRDNPHLAHAVTVFVLNGDIYIVDPTAGTPPDRALYKLLTDLNEYRSDSAYVVRMSPGEITNGLSFDVNSPQTLRLFFKSLFPFGKDIDTVKRELLVQHIKNLVSASKD